MAKILDDYAFKSEWPKDPLPRAERAIPEEFGKVLLVIDDHHKTPYWTRFPYRP